MLAPGPVDPSLAKLPDLGRLEDQLEKGRRRLQAIPGEKKSLEDEIEKLKAILAKERESLTALEKEKRSKEKDLAEEMEKIKNREARLMEIKTNKEYQAAVKEVETAKSMITAGEDKILELMEAIEAHANVFAAAEKKLKGEETHIQEQLEALTREASELAQRVVGVEQERDAILKEFAPSTKALIDRARAIKEHPLAEVRGERCQACHINIPPQLFIEIRKLEKAFQCPSCHRVLYFDTQIVIEA